MSALLVAIEGIDGSGKGTQATRLCDGLRSTGRSAGLLRFPRYDDTAFGRTVAQYLNGAFGDLQSADPHLVALVYAGDRFESLPLIRADQAAHDVLVFDRYVPSNLAHQAAKVAPAERPAFLAWLQEIEYDVYKLPRPDLVFWLDMPVPTAQLLIARKPSRRYTAKQADLHEADAGYLARTADVYRQLAADDRRWHVVPCCPGGELRSPDSVHQEILDAVRKNLA